MSRTGGALLVVTSAVAFGSMALCAHIASDGGLDTYSVLALRFAIAAAVLGGVVRVRKAGLPRGRDLLRCVLMGLTYACMAWTYFTALLYVPSSTVSLVLYAYPVIVALSAAALGIERIGTIEIASLLAVCLGLNLVLSGGHALQWHGLIFAGAAAVLYSAYILAGARLSPSVDRFGSTFVVVGVCAAFFECAALLNGQMFPASALQWGAILVLALGGTALAICAFLVGLKKTGPTLASVLSTLEPVVTVMLAIEFLDELPDGRVLAGATLLIGAAIVLAIFKGRAQRTEAEKDRAGGDVAANLGEPS